MAGVQWRGRAEVKFEREVRGERETRSLGDTFQAPILSFFGNILFNSTLSTNGFIRSGFGSDSE